MLVLDEVKIKESLVFDKHETEVVGFVDMGDINNKLADLEKECSTNHQHLPSPLTYLGIHWLAISLCSLPCYE